mgnify:CR=1 FL=1
MQFQVPQFIDVENKIVGPLTLKQFLYLAAAVIIIFILFLILKIGAWLIFSIIIGGVAAAFAFIKYNGRPLNVFFTSVLNYLWRPRVYIWQKTQEAPLKGDLSRLQLQIETSTQPIPKRERGLFKSILEGLRGKEEKFEIIRKLTGQQEVARRIDYR